MMSPAAQLRALMAKDVPVVAPLVLDPLSGKLAEAAGFGAAYLGGGTLGYVKTATEANLTLTQMAQALTEIRAASALPLILDGQCGWGDAMHMRHTVSTAEAAGAAAIEIEDQLMPKRAHHHVGIEHLISTELMAEKIRVAAATRRDPDFVIIARTNACRTADLDEAARRAEAYKLAGADMILVLPRSMEDAEGIARRVAGPLVFMGPGGLASLPMPMPDLRRLGYHLVIDGVTPFYARQRALRLCYEAMAQGRPDPTVGEDFAEEADAVHRAIDLAGLLAIELRTVER